MNFSVHLSDEVVARLNQTARKSGRKRNALIREAVTEWLERRHVRKWPPEVLNFRGIPKLRRFEENRKELKPPRSPFDDLSA